MNKYIVNFRGRKRGAIGVFYSITEFIEADNIEEAKNKLYEKNIYEFEHLFDSCFTILN
jgi:hypothetical protein